MRKLAYWSGAVIATAGLVTVFLVSWSIVFGIGPAEGPTLGQGLPVVLAGCVGILGGLWLSSRGRC